MNLTRPEKKYCWDFGYRKIKCPCEEEVCSHLERNKIIDDMSAYQNQQMKGLESIIEECFGKCFMSCELATRIREMIGGEK